MEFSCLYLHHIKSSIDQTAKKKYWLFLWGKFQLQSVPFEKQTSSEEVGMYVCVHMYIYIFIIELPKCSTY